MTTAARILDCLAAHPDGRFPLEIAEETGVKAGQLWPMLAEMERRGVLSSDWGERAPNGLRRRIYRLVPGNDGRAA